LDRLAPTKSSRSNVYRIASADDIAGHGGEVGEEGAEAVDRQAVVGAAVAGLALGGLGALRLGDDGGPCGVGRGLVVIAEQNRFELLTDVPFDVIGQHA
jgi:hypothetical protein